MDHLFAISPVKVTLDYVMARPIAHKWSMSPLWSPNKLLIRCYKDSYFPPDVAKYAEYEKILKRTDFRRLCSATVDLASFCNSLNFSCGLHQDVKGLIAQLLTIYDPVWAAIIPCTNHTKCRYNGFSQSTWKENSLSAQNDKMVITAC